MVQVQRNGNSWVTATDKTVYVGTATYLLERSIDWTMSGKRTNESSHGFRYFIATVLQASAE